MHTSKLSITSVLCATFLGSGFAQSQNTCSDNRPISNDDYKNYDPVRISPGVVCDANTSTGNDSCPLQVWAYISYGTRFNVSFTDAAQRDALIDFIGGGAQDPIQIARSHISGIVANETLQVPQGKNAYVDFAEEYACQTSLVSGCQGTLADFDETYIEACYPTYNTGSGTIPMFYDKASLRFVDAETARSLTDQGPYAMNNIDLAPDEPCNGVCSANGTSVGSNETSSSSGSTGVEQQQAGSGANSLAVSGAALGIMVVGLAFAPF